MTTQTTEKDITELSKEWYTLIGPEHHKDRDCHWKIVTKWSYGEPPVYKIEHLGYILGNIDIGCQTYPEALETLKKTLQKSIAEEKELQASSEKEAQMALEIKKIEDEI